MSQPKCSKCDGLGYVTESSQPHPEGKLVAIPTGVMFGRTQHCDCDANLRFVDPDDED